MQSIVTELIFTNQTFVGVQMVIFYTRQLLLQFTIQRIKEAQGWAKSFYAGKQ